MVSSRTCITLSQWRKFTSMGVKMQFALKIVCIVLLLAKNSEQQADPPRYWPNLENITNVVAVITEEECPFVVTADTVFEPMNYEYLIDQIDGNFGMELWFHILSRLGFTFKFLIPPGSSKNSLSAVTQMVANGDAHISFVPTVFVPEETKGLVITQPTHSTRYKLFIQSPTSVSTSLSLGKVFTPVLWLAIIVSMLMMGIILIFIEFVGQKAKIRSYLATPADIGQLVIVIIGCFCYQGAIQIASGCSGRVLVWTSLICGYLIYISYNTLVISQLTTVSFKPPFDTLQDMAAKKTHKLIVRNQTALLDDIKITRIKDGKRGIMADVWDELLPMKPKAENLYNSKQDIVRLCKENIAMLDSELEINAGAQQRYKCNAISLKDSYFRSNLGFVLNKNNTYNNVVIRMFNRMRETGIINRMRRYLDQPEVGPLQPLPTLNPIQLETLIPMLVVLYLGMFFSLITLGIEIAITRGGGKLKKRLYEKGFRERRDYIFFWRTLKKSKMELEEEESDTEDEDVEQPSTTPIITVSKTPDSPVKVKKEVEINNKASRESMDVVRNKNANSRSIERIIGVTDPYYKTPVRAPEDKNIEKPRILRRQDRVRDLTTLLPKPIAASLMPVYLDKNTLRDQDSSTGSTPGSSVRDQDIKPSPKLTPNATPKPTPKPSPKPSPRGEHENKSVKSKDSSGSSIKPDARPLLDVPWRNEAESKANTPKPSPRYDPQELMRPRPSPRFDELVPPSNEFHNYVNVPPKGPPEVPPRLKRSTPPETQGEQSRRPVPITAQPMARLRSDPPLPSQKSPPSRQSSPKKELVEDWTPMYYNEMSPQRQNRRAGRNRALSAERQVAPPLYRNLQLESESDGFLDRHSILDRNLARRMRNTREPDPFADID